MGTHNESHSHIKFYFIIKNGIKSEDDVSEDMKSAFKESKKYFEHETSITWIEEDKCLEFENNLVTKEYVFIFEEFDGRAFDNLTTTKALLLGPRCLLTCLMENDFIPLGSSPVYTTAMRNLKICASGLSNTEKLKIKRLVTWMGGYYSDVLDMSCTHLVSDTVKSTKYEKAASISLEIMHPDWVKDVWECSKLNNIKANHNDFSKHKLPTFFSLNITTTGLEKNVKFKIKELVEKHGGNYNGSFKSEITEVLILEEDMCTSEKYKAAIKFKKDCLNPKWIIDSVNKGYAIEMENYRVKDTKVSTPIKNNLRTTSISNFNADCTDLSEISYILPPNLTINETCASISSTSSSRITRTPTLKYKEVLKDLSITIAKKSGPFLDGCNVYLCGFTAEEKEKLNKILNVGSATRYDQLTEKVTHIIVGEPDQSDLKYLKDSRILATTLKLDWLQQCITEKQPTDEKNYLYEFKNLLTPKDLECASPASKKSIELMNKNNTFKKPIIPKLNLDAQSTLKNPNLETKENELLEQYLQKNTSTLSLNDKCDSIEMDELTIADEDISTLLEGLKICVNGFELDDQEKIEKQCLECGAIIVDEYFMDAVNYLILPAVCNTSIELTVTPYEIVNDIWLEDVIQEKELISKEYYHEPVIVDDDIKPLLNLSIVTSSYTGTERAYIVAVATALGANIEDAYAKKNKPLLICPLAEGAKYNAAIKWRLPVVSSLWLYECAKQKIKIPYDKYLLNNSAQTSFEVTSSTIPKTIEECDKLKKNLNEIKNAASDDISTELHRKHIRENLEKIDNDSAQNKRKAETINKIGTPLKNPRITALKPDTPDVPIPSPGPLNLSDTLKTMETPIRNIMNRILPQMNITPTTFTKTPSGVLESPEDLWGLGRNASAKTRRKNKRRLETLDAYCRPFDVARRSTPFSEIKRRFWQEALGDDYSDEINVNTQFENHRVIQDTQNNEGDENICVPQDLPGSSNSTDSNEPFEMLKNFIENRVIEKPTYDKIEEVDSVPFRLDSELIVETQQDVGWRDPSDFNISRRFKKKSEMRYKGTPKFIISCSTDEQKKILQQQIKELNGDLGDNSIKYDESCSHIICEEPNRGEKILCSIAAGKWVLGMKYIAESIVAGHFLDEELYEWGNPKATSLPKLSAINQSLANSAYRWRQKISNDTNLKSGVFTTFRVLLHVSSKTEQFKNLIRAGGGTVLNVKPPYEKSDIALRATHCLVDNKSELLKNDHRALAEAGVNVLSVMYLNKYLTSDDLPDKTDFLLKI